MKRKRFTEEQIIGVLKEVEEGAKAADLARRCGIFEATIYNWKAKRIAIAYLENHLGMIVANNGPNLPLTRS